MKCDLPDPKLPSRYAALLLFSLIADAMNRKRVVVGVGELRRDDVVLERAGAVRNAARQRHHEVALVDGLWDRDEVLQQRHAAPAFAFRPRVGAGGRHARRSSRVIASSASCPSSQPSKYWPGGPP